MSDSKRKDMANGSDLRSAVERFLHGDLDLIVLDDDIAIRAWIRLEDFEQCKQGRDLLIHHYKSENGKPFPIAEAKERAKPKEPSKFFND